MDSKERIIEAFTKIELHECEICGRFIGEKEYTEAERVCYKHWDENAV